MRARYIWLVSAVILAFIVGRWQFSSPDERELSAEETGNMLVVSEGDPEMNGAIAEARAHLPEFLQALLQPGESNYGFAVKYPFEEPLVHGVEHLWLVDVVASGNDFIGVVDVEPMVLKQIRLGQKLTVPQAGITDWMYYDDEKRVGAYTARVVERRNAAKKS